MPTNAAISNVRRLAGSGALLAVGAAIGSVGVHRYSLDWSLVGSAGVIAVAGVALARRWVVGQIFGRAAAWLVLAPTALIAIASSAGGHGPELMVSALAAGSGAALLLARPMLHTAEAKASFAPSRFRSWLLAGATASTATAMLTSFIGLEYLQHSWSSNCMSIGAGLLALAAGLLGSAFGVLRMRTWGILLGVLTSFLALGAAAVLRDVSGVALALTAVPGMVFFLLPVLIAKRERAQAESASYVRMAAEAEAQAETLPHQVRVAVDEDVFVEEDAPARLQQHV